MDAEDRRLLLAIHEKVSGIKPVLDSHTIFLGALESRTRSLEVEHGEHRVKIDRLQDDLDGLGRKVRRAPQSESRTLWPLFIAFALENWHAFVVVGGTALTAVAILWRHWPR